MSFVASVRLFKKNGLRTSPDFEGAWIDGLVHFQVVPQNHDSATPLPQDGSQDGGDPSGDQPLWVARDPSHQISKLASANKEVATITPNDTVEKAITKMLFHDFSQLPVSTGDRNLEGVVSWKTIGKRISLNASATRVREVMDHAHEVRHDSSMFDAMRIIAEHDYVVVRARDKTICGIVTATDLNEQFRYLSEPFLLLSEIENLLRNIIGESFSLPILKEVCDSADSREVSSLSDLTFGEYIRLLENKERWEKLGLPLDRGYFCETLDFVRKTRNEIMHFDPDGIEESQIRKLRESASALRAITFLSSNT